MQGALAVILHRLCEQWSGFFNFLSLEVDYFSRLRTFLSTKFMERPACAGSSFHSQLGDQGIFEDSSYMSPAWSHCL